MSIPSIFPFYDLGIYGQVLVSGDNSMECLSTLSPCPSRVLKPWPSVGVWIIPDDSPQHPASCIVLLDAIMLSSCLTWLSLSDLIAAAIIDSYTSG
jgi:hypothetical protein